MGTENETVIDKNKKLCAHPSIVLREEADDWAILYDPDTGHSYAVNPVSVLIWKHLDGKHTLNDLFTVVHEKCKNVPDKVENQIEKFIKQLFRKEMVQYKIETG